MDTNTNKYYNTFDMMEEAIKTKEVCEPNCRDVRTS